MSIDAKLLIEFTDPNGESPFVAHSANVTFENHAFILTHVVFYANDGRFIYPEDRAEYGIPDEFVHLLVNKETGEVLTKNYGNWKGSNKVTVRRRDAIRILFDYHPDTGGWWVSKSFDSGDKIGKPYSFDSYSKAAASVKRTLAYYSCHPYDIICRTYNLRRDKDVIPLDVVKITNFKDLDDAAVQVKLTEPY